MTPDEIARSLTALGVPVEAARHAAELHSDAGRIGLSPRLVQDVMFDVDRRKMFVWLQEHDLPMCEFEYRFATPRKWMFDYAWPAQMVALEKEGFDHRKHDRYTSDLEKYNAAALAGWTLLRATPKNLYSEGTLDLLQRALA